MTTETQQTALTTTEPEKAIKINANAPAGNQQTLKAFLTGPEIKKQLGEALGKSGITADDMNRLALVGTTKQPMILKCTLSSIFRALLDAAALGITVGGLNGRGYLVPRMVTLREKKDGKDIERKEYQCFLDPGYRGFMDIARDGGCGLLQAEVICENDLFEYWCDPLPRMKWKPAKLGTPRGAPIGAFAVAQLPNGTPQIEVVSKEDLDKIMSISETGKKNVGPWNDWYDQQARKTAMRRLCKFLPVKGRENQAKLERAMILSDRADTGDPTIGEVVESTGEVVDVSDQVKGALEAKNEAATLSSMASLESELDEVLG